MSNLRECENDYRILTTKDVVKASSVIMKSGNYPVRLVLREKETDGRVEYVVHLELLKMDLDPARDHLTVAFKHEGFQTGSYCSTYERALEVYAERVKKLFA
jgi:hypothetical protein